MKFRTALLTLLASVFGIGASAVAALAFQNLYVGGTSSLITCPSCLTMPLSQSVLFTAANSYDIGSSSLPIKNVYATGTYFVNDGTAGAPSITSPNDTDSGFYHTSASGWFVSQNGAGTFRFGGTNGNYTYNSLFPITNNAQDLGGSALAYRNMYASSTIYANTGAGVAIPAFAAATSGNATTPAFGFQNDPDTGMYSGGANDIQFTTNGGVKLDISGSIGFSVNQTFDSNNLRDIATGALSIRNFYASGTGAFGSGILLGAGTNITVGGANARKGLTLSGSGALSALTAGATMGQVELAGNAVNLYTPLFDATTTNYVSWGPVQLEKCYDGGTLNDVTFDWSPTPTGTGNVVWGIQGKVMSSSTAISAAWGAPVYVTSTNSTFGKYIDWSDTATTNLTLGGSANATSSVMFRVFRSAAQSDDTFAASTTLISVKMTYGASCFSD